MSKYAGPRGAFARSREGQYSMKVFKRNKFTRLGILSAALLLALAAGWSGAQEVTSSRKVIKTVAAQYPSVLKRRGIGGTVKLRVQVNPNGTVKDAVVQGGNPILADCAVKAVKQWVFAPAEKEENIEISVGFDPNSTSE